MNRLGVFLWVALVVAWSPASLAETGAEQTLFTNVGIFDGYAENLQGGMHVLVEDNLIKTCLLYTSPSPRDQRGSRMPSSA